MRTKNQVVKAIEVGTIITGKGLDGEYREGEYREGEYTGMVVQINEGHVYPYKIQWANGPFMVNVGWVKP